MASKKTKQDLLLCLSSSDTAIIDIRTFEEYENCHIQGSINMEASTLMNSLVELTKYETIICVCNHGHKRSQQAADNLTSLGLSNIYYLEGGVEGWFK